MEKRFFSAAIICVFIGVFLVHCHVRTLSSNEAKEILEIYLTNLGRMEYEGGEELELGLNHVIRERRIEGKPVYVFTLWFKEDVPMIGGHRDSYWAITKDGSKIYQCNLGNDEWIEGYAEGY